MLIWDVDVNKYSSVVFTRCVYSHLDYHSNSRFHLPFVKPSSIKSEISQPPTVRGLAPNHSMTITIHQGSDVGGPIAGLLDRSASKLLFNVSHNSPKQSGLLSVSHARPFKWAWYMTHKGLQVSTPLWKEREGSRGDGGGGWVWIKCLGFGILVFSWLTVG